MRRRSTRLPRELTSTELRDAIRAGKTTILVPIGGTEQNGPHMALGKHNARVQVLAERIARALGNALVAPVIAYVPEGGVDPPTGAHALRRHDHRAVGRVRSVARIRSAQLPSCTAFATSCSSATHGGYQKEHRKPSRERSIANGRRRRRARTRSPSTTASSTTDYPKLLRARGLRDDEIGTHAGLADTSLMLALDPALVRSDRSRRARRRADGVTGDPRRASAGARPARRRRSSSRKPRDAIRKAAARR